jgi:5'-nucleotidase
MKKIVLVDLDGICANLLDEWLGRYNKDSGLNITLDDINKFHIHECVPAGHKIYDYIRKPGIYDNLKPIEGAQEGMELLNQTHDVIILSTPSRAPETAGEKIHWCKKYFPFIDRRQIMLGARKELVCGDFFIDDSPENLFNWHNANVDREMYDAKTITIDYPYNRGFEADFRAMDYKNTDKAWGEILHYIMAES